MTQITDPNGRVFQTVYDGLDRVKEEKQPDKDTPTTLVTKATYSYNDSANPRSITKTDYLTDNLQLTAYSYLDGLDRTIQTRTRAEDTNTYSVKDVVYDALGHVQKESLPYFGTGTGYTSATTNNALYTTYTYDALDRVLTATNAVGATSHAYDQWKETVTDAENKIKDYTSDAYGNLVKVEEHNGAAVHTTIYTYNGLNKLLNITDALGNVRNFTYDGLGRRLTAQDLHAPADGTFGTWQYTYDAASNLVTQLDPKSQTVDFSYDDLNRVLTEDFTGETGTEKSYEYDTCTEGKGKLCNVSADADSAYTYYATGEVKQETKTIDTNNYLTNYSYDRQGNTTNIKYPDNSEVQYAYNAAGLTETVQQKGSGGSFADVVSDFDYSPLGQVIYQLNGNGSETTNTYDVNELYRLKHKVTTTPGGGGGPTNQAPSAPTLLLAEGQTNPASVTDTTPELSGVYEDPDSGDIATDYRIQVTNTQGDWTYPVWDSGKTTLGSQITSGSRSEDITYAGAPLTLNGSTYWWRMKFWDDDDAEGAWSDGSDSFTMDNQTSSNLLYNAGFETTGALDQGNYQRWEGSPLNGSTFVEYTATNPITGNQSMRIVKNSTNDQAYVIQSVDVVQGVQYIFRADLYNEPGISGTPYIDNIEVGGCWCNQGLWWSQPLQAGYQQIEVYFTPYVTGRVAFQFRWNNAVGETRIDNVEVVEAGTGGYMAESSKSAFHWAPSLRYIPGMPYQYDKKWNVVRVIPPLDKKTEKALKHNYPKRSFDGISPKLEYAVTTVLIADALPEVPSGEGIVRMALGSNLLYNPNFEITDPLDQGDYHRWGAEPLSGNTFVEYTTTNPIEGVRSLRIVKPSPNGETSVRQIVEVEQGKTYIFRATLYNEPGISGQPYIDNYEIGGCWCNQGLWWNQALQEGTQQVEAYFTPYVTGPVNFQFKWNNAQGETRIDNVEVIDPSGGGSTPPTADFSAAPLSGTAPLTVSFTDLSTEGSNPITSWAWDIDNNGTTDYTTPNPQHVYPSPGTYSVKLTVSDGTDEDSKTKTNYIVVNAPPSGPLTIQDLMYTYDAVGNIIQIVDASETDTAKTITYTYDDLHRLLTSSISGAANGDNVGRTYTYSAIGNILTASDQGTYLYESTNYANPHAVTKVGTAVYGYDNNGNLTSDSVWAHSWDYNNKLTQSQKTGSTVTYQYDHSGQRTKYANGTKTIRYANKLYNTDGTTATKHIYAGNQLIGTVEGSTLQYVHTDHLTGSNVATDSSGTMIQLLDYQPYGEMRIDWKSGTYDEQRKHSGHEFDRDTEISYANARYYRQDIGRWMSQDPVFLAMGNEAEIQRRTGDPYLAYLVDPQNLNSYSYAKNNSLKHVDVTGEYWETVVDVVSLGLSLYDFSHKPSFLNGLFVGLDAIGTALPFPAVFGYLKNSAGAVKIAKYFEGVASNAGDIAQLGKLFIKNATYKFGGRSWSAGRAGNDVANLVGHFYKHGGKFGFNSIDEYYQAADKFISEKQFTHVFTEGSDKVLYNTGTKTRAILNAEGQIKTFHPVDDPDIVIDYAKRISGGNYSTDL